MKAGFSFNKAAEHQDPDRKAGIRRVADWVEDALPEEEQEDTHVMVNQIECAEEGCPPVECVIALLRKKPAPKLMFKARGAHELTVAQCGRPRRCPALARRSSSLARR